MRNHTYEPWESEREIGDWEGKSSTNASVLISSLLGLLLFCYLLVKTLFTSLFMTNSSARTAPSKKEVKATMLQAEANS